MLASRIRSQIRPILIAAFAVFVLAQIVALSPSSVEQNDPDAEVDPQTLLDDGTSLAEGIPKEKIPDYSVDRFNYVSTLNGRKNWKLVAAKAFLYNGERIVHSRQVTAYLYDSNDQVTLVKGKEAKYFMDGRDLEIYGQVETLFPDGFLMKSDYMRYHPDERRIVIPVRWPVSGTSGEAKTSQRIDFTSHGLESFMERSEVILSENVEVNFVPATSGSATPNTTKIRSDRAVIDRTQQISHFTMGRTKPLDKRFVEVMQPTLYARGRRADLSYGDFAKLLDYMTLFEDVFVKELPLATDSKKQTRYGTGGRAEFNAQKNIILLKEFPQVYQDKDTVAGDVIILHRDSDVVEVENSNAFSEGKAGDEN